VITNDLDKPDKRSVEILVGGVLGDLQNLIEQQFRLTRRELEDEVFQMARSVAILAIGFGFLLSSIILYSFAAANLLHRIVSSPAIPSETLPMWGCQSIIGGFLALLGLIVIRIGVKSYQAIKAMKNPLAELLLQERNSG
jgi:hypothetical protein